MKPKKCYPVSSAIFYIFTKTKGMRFYFFLMMLFSACVAHAQDFGRGTSLNIPPVSSPITTPPPISPSIKTPNVFDNATKSEGIKGPVLNSNFGKTRDFANPNEKYIEKLNKKEGETDTAIRKNLYLGDVKTKAESVRIVYRDHEAPDGDMIMVLVNDQVIKPRITLDSDSQGFDLSLEKGFNKIDFQALNQGLSGPNTAEFEVYDDQGQLISSNKWNLATGFKATIIVVKE